MRRQNVRVAYDQTAGWCVIYHELLPQATCLRALQYALVQNEQRAAGLPPGDRKDAYRKALGELREIVAGRRNFEFITVTESGAPIFRAEAGYTPKLYVGGPRG
jgi:hypothetical protein